ncbi:hypothetical protein [Acidipropionibacterium timonense]|uniref:hypothetical protein n=1 Tax=Acidipropionibacterium timonense TaxID=2161818 RepID=UPI001AEC6DE4|nr:hypothetical protein [Acidipropionibacterium timonense]
MADHAAARHLQSQNSRATPSEATDTVNLPRRTHTEELDFQQRIHSMAATVHVINTPPPDRVRVDPVNDE